MLKRASHERGRRRRVSDVMPARKSPSRWIEQVRSAESSGDLFTAYDLATQALAKHPGNVELQYLATRILARTGATDEAAALFVRYRLERRRKLDIAALGARIAKDRALAAPTGRPAALRAAAHAYARLFVRTRSYYPAINAATLYLLAGDRRRAQLYARRADSASRRRASSAPSDAYFRLATRAEAALISGDPEAAKRFLQQAATRLAGDYSAAASTRKQLRLVCRSTGIDPRVLDPIRQPAVLHYQAPAMAARPGGARLRRREQIVAHEIADFLARHRVGFAYGSLSAGGEILCAEACLRVGVELHVVLPFRQDEFVRTAVRPVDARWVRRFNACLAGAKSVTFATADSYQGDNSLFGYSCRLAMGMALLRAQHLDAAAVRLQLDAAGRGADATGSAVDLAKRHAGGGSSRRIAAADATPGKRVGKSPRRRGTTPPRFPRALLFGDVKGFSQTPDHLVPVFQRRLMGAIAKVLHRFDRHVLYRNSWGDAIYVVLDDPAVAANCALAIQRALKLADLTRFGLSSELKLRLGAHFGPVYDGHDPIRDEPTFFGAHTTIAARLEPVTAPGRVYVTEAMAAAIAIAPAGHLHAEYVGNSPMAKGFGSTRMYALSRMD
jgi:hypothetical protein